MAKGNLFGKGNIPYLRALQLYTEFLVLCLAGYCISEEKLDLNGKYYGEDVYALAISTIAVVITPIIYIKLLTFIISDKANWYLYIVWDVLMNLVYFACFVALAAKHKHHCPAYLDAEICQVIKANIGMAAATWAFFCVSNYFVIREFMNGYSAPAKQTYENRTAVENSAATGVDADAAPTTDSEEIKSVV